MADEQNNETSETPEESAAGAVPQEGATAPESQAAAPEESEAPTSEAPVAAEASEPKARATPAEPVEQLAPKERRRKARSTHTGRTREPRSPEDRHAERQAVRRAKALKRRARRSQERVKRTAARSSASAPQALAPVHPPAEGARRVRQGVVVSDKADKTITVRIDIARRHRRYEKIVRSSSTLHAHDENNDAHEGDTVRVIESRPLSRTKRWRLVDVLERAR